MSKTEEFQEKLRLLALEYKKDNLYLFFCIESPDSYVLGGNMGCTKCIEEALRLANIGIEHENCEKERNYTIN